MAFTINQDTVLFVWLIEKLAGFIKIARKPNLSHGSTFGDIRLRDTGMIELLIVDKKAIRDDTSF